MSISYRLFDFHKEDYNQLFRLYELTYGSTEPIERRWQWQYLDHPRTDEIQVVVAEADGTVVGFTSHFPMDVMFRGEVLTSFHGSGSMIDPAYRRKGIMWGMVQKRSELLPLYYARGIAPRMYELLMKFGYTPISPDNYMIKIVSKPRWLMRKIKLSRRTGELRHDLIDDRSEFYFVDSFGEEFDEFFKRVAPQYHLTVVKDCAFMNWRYTNQPYIEYHIIYRKLNDRIVSAMVLKGYWHIGKIVDILWDNQVSDEPYASIKFACDLFDRAGFTNVYTWGTLKSFRDSLTRCGFMNLKESPLFCVTTRHDNIAELADGDRLHFVDGDGDYEFLE